MQKEKEWEAAEDLCTRALALSPPREKMAATPPLAASLALAKARNNDPARCGFELCRHILMGVRELRAHRPDLVLKYGSYLLQNHSSSLSHEVWATYEQVYISLLQHARYGSRRTATDGTTDGAEMQMAQEHITALSAQFPDSLRVKRLEGMMWEAKGEAELALDTYEEILQEDPSNLLVVKRQVAILRARGGPARTADAAKKLCEYLGTFCSDHEAWLMLHDLYLATQQYKRAAFAIEELILINPMSYIYHIRAGEVTYTMGVASNGGSHDQLLTARKYFAHALELKPDCLRALYGILLVCAALGSSTKGKGTKVDTGELLAHIQPLLLKCYTPPGAAAHPMRPLVTSMMKRLTAGAPVAAGA